MRDLANMKIGAIIADYGKNGNRVSRIIFNALCGDDSDCQFNINSIELGYACELLEKEYMLEKIINEIKNIPRHG